jgi:hypothetical protein
METKESNSNEAVSEQITALGMGSIGIEQNTQHHSPTNTEDSPYLALPVLQEKKNKTMRISLQKHSQKTDVQLPALKVNEKSKQSPLAPFKPGEIPKPPPLPNFEVPFDLTGN